MKKIFAVFVAAALAAALFAGCAPKTASSAAAPSASSAAATPAPTAAPTAKPAASSGSSAEKTAGKGAVSYTAEDLAAVLAPCCKLAAGTAGSSLKEAAAAAGLLEFSAKYLTADNKNTAITGLVKWYDGLAEEDRTALTENWDSLKTTAQSIAKDPAGSKDLLSDAGVETDFTKLDLTNSLLIFDALDTVMTK